MRFSKRDLDTLGTLFGAIAGIVTVLIHTDYIDEKLGGAIAGISTVLMGVVIQRPADESPTTEEVEENLVQQNEKQEVE